MHITNNSPIVEEITENDLIPCTVDEAQLIKQQNAGFVVLETKFVDNDTALFEPVPGNVGTHTLCPGLVRLESDRDNKKSRFIIKYINAELQNIYLEPGRVLGYIQLCVKENLDVEKSAVNAMTEMSNEERQKGLSQTIDEMFPPESKENKVLKGLMTKYPSVFANDNDPPNITPYYYHTIRLQSDPKPKSSYQIPACLHDKVQKTVKVMEQQGIIRPSKSSFHSPLVPIVKKDGKIRLCIDFRNLNKHVINDCFPLPNINHILHNLGKGKLFTCLDMKQGYHQIPLAEESKAFTAFVAPGGLWEHNVLPMGLKDSPAAFCRIINQVLVGLVGDKTFVYIDDIIIQGSNFEDHVANLEKVMSRLQDAQLTLRLSKCTFFKNSVKFLGHIISSEGLKPQPEKVDAINAITLPKTVKELQSFLGMTNYYRKFIRNYADIATPLSKLTGGKIKEQKSRRNIQWNKEAEEAFEKLKAYLSEKITLKFPDFAKPFYLTTDASNIAIGGVLQQKDEAGNLRPLTYFSRQLNSAETRYSTIEREALAIVYGLKINRNLCLGYPIVINTDHKPLIWLFSTSNPNSRITRWQMLVSEFDIDVKYVPGKENIVADCLSRLKNQEDRLVEETVLAINPEEESEFLEWNLEELIRHQDMDDYYGLIKYMIKQGYNTNQMREELNTRTVEKSFRKLKLDEMIVEEDILYRVATNDYDEMTRQIMVPKSYIKHVLRLAHSQPTAGHGGVKITLARARRFSFWPGMQKDVEQFCKECRVCRCYKRMGDAPAPLRRYPDVYMPFERVHMDIIGPMGKSDNGFKYCFVMIDVLTRYLICEPLKTKSALEVAQVFFDSIICKQGVPKTVVTDNGKEFVNSIFEEVAKLLNMTHLKTTAYHPQANGVIERANGSVVNILRTLVQENTTIWDTMLPLTAFAYNTGYNRSIRDCPFYLMYLRDPSYPFEIVKEEKSWYNIDDFKQEMATKANRIYARCQLYLEEAKGELEKNQSKRSRIKPLSVGNRVYVKRVPTKGEPTKLQPPYSGPFRVIEKISDVVIKVRNIRSGAIKTLHTDRVRVLHEDNTNSQHNPNVRRTYPVHDEGESKSTKLSLQQVDPFPFSTEATDNDSASEEEEDNVVDDPQVNNGKEETAQQQNVQTVPRYNLRSSSNPPDLPLVMNKPIEYKRT